MSHIISFYSYRRGTGKTNILASIAVLMAQDGLRVGIIDIDLRSPSLHVLFQVDTDDVGFFLNDYVKGVCSIEQTALKVPLEAKGELFIVPSHPGTMQIMDILKEKIDPLMLSEAYQQLCFVLELDVLIIDTQAGINPHSMASVAFADTSIIVLRLDQQNLQGTAILVELAQELGAKKLHLLVNDLHKDIDRISVKDETETLYKIPVIDVFPHSEEMLYLASHTIFTLKHPDNPLTRRIRRLATYLSP